MVTYGALRRPTAATAARIKGPSQPNLSANLVRRPSFSNVQSNVSSGGGGGGDAWMYRPAPADAPAMSAGGGMRRRAAGAYRK